MRMGLFMSHPLDVGREIGQQTFQRLEQVGGFRATDMPVIALAAFIVIADEPVAVHNVDQAVFVSMAPRRHRTGHLPDPDLGKRSVFIGLAASDQ
jgi:hypothetical protein